MLTIGSLRLFGANVEEGLGRCMQNEGFYLRMVALACDDANFDRLLDAAERDELRAPDR